MRVIRCSSCLIRSTRGPSSACLNRLLPERFGARGFALRATVVVDYELQRRAQSARRLLTCKIPLRQVQDHIPMAVIQRAHDSRGVDLSLGHAARRKGRQFSELKIEPMLEFQLLTLLLRQHLGARLLFTLFPLERVIPLPFMPTS